MKIMRLVLVNALLLMAHGTHFSRPDPATPSAEYRQQVTTSIQHLVSHQRPRDPQMSSVGTGRLILEGVVENLRIYRIHREEKAREAKGKDEDGRRRIRRREGGYERNGSSERRRGDDGGGQIRTRRRRHSSDGDGHRGQTGANRSLRYLDSRGDRTELGRSEQHRNQAGSGDGPQPPRGEHSMTSALPAGAAIAGMFTGKAEQRLSGPDGTPFGYLPTRDKGIGLLAHAKTMYQHIKAEQDAGHRSKGPSEKLIHGWLKKRKNTKSEANGTVEEEELLIEKNASSHGVRREQRGLRGKRRTSKAREGNGDTRRGKVGGDLPPTELKRSFEQSKSSVCQPTVSRSSSRPQHFCGREGAPDHALKGIQIGRESIRAPSVHNETPTPPASASISTPFRRRIFSVREVDVSRSRSGSRAPTIRVQSPAPPVTAISYPLTSSVLNMPAPVVANAPAIPPPPPLPPPPPALSKRPVLDQEREAFLTSVQAGAKPMKVSDEGKDASLARQDEAQTEEVARQVPVYEETPHSYDVEGLENAQAVEGKERRQEEKHATRLNTPFIAPRPRLKLSENFQDELTAKLGKMKLDKSSTEAASSVDLKVVRPRASNETWRTVYSEQAEEKSMPNQQFRQDLKNQLSAKGTPRPTAAMTPTHAPSRVETPAQDVFVNLSANITGPGWSFDNVPKVGKA